MKRLKNVKINRRNSIRKMRYFLVNNSYQYEDAVAHVSHGFHASLLVIPDNMDHIDKHRFFRVYIFEKPDIFRSKPKIIRWCLRFISTLQQKNLIRNSLQPKNTDSLLCYAEHEPLNQYLIRKFKRAGANVYLIENGGVQAYITNRQLKSEKLTVREVWKQISARLQATEWYFSYLKVDGHLHRRLNDHFFDGIIYYRDVATARKMPRFIVKSPISELAHLEDSVIFLSQPLYNYYGSVEWCFSKVCKILSALEKNFPVVFFKFHPRDHVIWRKRIQEYKIKTGRRIHIIDAEAPVESIVKDYRPRIAVSFFSSALFSLFDLGLEPVFLYKLMRAPPMISLDAVLEELGYNFPLSLQEISLDFSSHLSRAETKMDSPTLVELLDQ